MASAVLAAERNEPTVEPTGIADDRRRDGQARIGTDRVANFV
jgi:hypothetical protein